MGCKKCSKCGCQKYDPFAGKTLIHDEEKCGGIVKSKEDDIIIIPTMEKGD